MDFATIANLRKYLSVKTSAADSIQIKFSMSIMSDPEAMRLAQSPPKMPDAVHNTDLNLFSRTLTMQFDPERISSPLLAELVSTGDDTRAAEIVEELHSTIYA